MPTKPKVFSLLIEDDNTGPILSVHATHASAIGEVESYCKRNWNPRDGARPKVFVIDGYQDRNEDFGYTIEECEVEG